MTKENENLKLIKIHTDIGIPVLIQDIPEELYKNSVVIQPSIPMSELNVRFKNLEFRPPIWFETLVEKSNDCDVFLIIKNINECPVEEQFKFIEILKYRSVGTFDLPKNCRIVASYTDLNQKKVTEEVYSFFAHIYW